MRKFLRIAAEIQGEIADLPRGTKLTPIRELAERFNVADLTIRHALKELKSRGAITQKVGKGTFTTGYMPDAEKPCGLLITGSSYSDVFPHIHREIIRAANQSCLRLISRDASCGDPVLATERAVELSEELIRARIGGIIFQPIQFAPHAAAITRRIMKMFWSARIPVVIIDCAVAEFEDNDLYDLVSIDNFNAGYRLALWLLSTGSKHICFQANPNFATSVAERIRGVKSVQKGHTPLLIAAPDNVNAVLQVLQSDSSIDTIICQNDMAAVRLEQTLRQLGRSVPGDIRLAGFDGVNTPPELVTMQQPCADLARYALNCIQYRMANPDTSPARIQLQATLLQGARSTI